MRTAPEQPGPRIRHGVRAFTPTSCSPTAGRGRVMFTESQASPALASRGAELITDVHRPGSRPCCAPGTLTGTPDGTDVELNALAIFGALAFPLPTLAAPQRR